MTVIVTKATLAAYVLAGLLVVLAPTTASAGWMPGVDISAEGEYDFGGEPQIAVGGPGRAVAIWTQRDFNGHGQIQAATKQPGGTWEPPVDLTPPAGNSSAPRVAMNEAGEAAAVWVHEGNIESAALTPQGIWIQPSGLSVPGGDLGNLDVVIDESGRSTAIWDHLDQSGPGSTYVIEAATRPPGGGWGQPHALTEDENNAWNPKLAVDRLGRVVAAWAHYTDDGNHTYIEAAEMSPKGEWSEPEELSDRAGKPFAPQVVAGAGRAVVVWALGNLLVGAYRDSGGPWEGPVGVSGSEPREPALAIGPGGDALAIWSESQEGKIVKSSVLPGGGTSWTKPVDISKPHLPEEGTRPGVAVDPAGDAVAVWAGSDGQHRVVESASGSLGGGWHEPVVISPLETWSDRPQVDIDGSGDAVALWRRLAEKQTVQAAVLDVTGPEFSSLSIPAAGTATQPLAFSVSPVDVWSAVGSTSWTFGDGASASGPAINHIYASAGTYQVTVTSVDVVGNASSASAPIVIAAAPAPSSGRGTAFTARVAWVKRGKALLRLRCRHGGRCRGVVKLIAWIRARQIVKRNGRRRVAKRTRRVLIGKARFGIPAGGIRVIRVRLNRKGKQLLRRVGRRRLKVKFTGRGVNGRWVVLKEVRRSPRG